MTKTMLVLDNWAGRRYYEVNVIGETPKSLRVKILSPAGVNLPGGRHVGFGKTTLVPKYAVINREE